VQVGCWGCGSKIYSSMLAPGETPSGPNDPRKFMPGTKTVFAGLKNPKDRKALIEFLKEQR